MAKEVDKVPSIDEIKEVFGQKDSSQKSEPKSSVKEVMPSKDEIKEVFGKSQVHAHKKHHITFFILLGVLFLTIGSYVAFEDEIVTFTGNIIGTDESIVDGFKEYFIEGVDLTNKTRFGVGLDEIYIDLYQEEKAMIASLNEECDTQKSALESSIRAEEQQQCDYEKESLQSTIDDLEDEVDSLCSCE